jgi:hypothetical protein
MTCGQQLLSPTSTWRRRVALAAGAATLLAAALAVGTGPAGAAPGGEDDQRDRTAQQLRVCDPTACYVAWRVVDSDHDGVSDADELMAGTDPHDARSRPGLQVVADLGARRELPSFEAGRGSFVLFPPEIVEMRSKDRPDLLGAFPMFSRKDAATRLGISADQMAASGVDPARTGMTIGLDRPGKEGGGLPGVQVAGIDVGLISAGTDPPQGTVAHGGVKGSYRTSDSSVATEYADGSRDVVTDQGGGFHSIQHTASDGSPGNTTDIHSSSHKDGDTTIFTEDRQVTDPGGNVISTSYSESHVYGDGAMSEITVVNEYVRDADGNVVGTVVTTTTSYISADGEYGSGSKTVEECDTGGSCVEVSYEFEDSDTVDTEEHVDPDADSTGGGLVTFEVVDGVLRTRGAAITVVQNWEAPGDPDHPEDPRRPGTLILVDDEQALTYTILEAPRVTEAQPEIRSDLPNPLEAAPPMGGGGGPCDGLC